MSDGKMVMDKKQVIYAMTETINEMNRQMAFQNGIPSDQVQQLLMQQQPELMRVNEMLYDKLVTLGVINN